MQREKNSQSTGRGAVYSWIALALLSILTACTDSRQQPAEQAIADVDAAIAAAGTAPAKYIPGELKAVQARLNDLRREYAKHHYAVVLEKAPEALQAARSLAPTAAAREAELIQSLRTEWAELAQVVPAELAAVAGRFEQAAAHRKRSKGMSAEDVRTGRNRMRDALALWDRALQEETAGRLPEAVTLAHQVRDMGRSVDMLAQAGAAGAPVK